MKKKSKRLIALLLSFLMIISMIPTTGLTVEAAAKPKLTKKTTSIIIGGTSKIKVKNVPKRAKITYRSAKKNIATVSKQGKVKGIKSGTAKIIVSVKKNSKTTKLTYKVTVKKPKLSKSKLSLKSGNTAKLSVKNKPKKSKYTWKSSNPRIVTVNKTGKVTAKGKGIATIRVKVKTTKKIYSLSCKVTVKQTSDNPNDVRQTYTVTFDSNGGSSVVSQTVEKNARATQPTAPIRNGYTFDGWYTAASGGQKFDFNIAITGNITLYAHWTAIPSQVPTPPPATYTVAFDSNGGSFVASQTVDKNSLATRPTDPTRSGYTFDGWYTAASGGQKFNFSTTITENITLYAHWSSNSSGGGNGGSSGGGSYVPPSETYYTVTFYMNNGTDTVHQSISVVADEMATEPADPARDGYIFNGWYEDAECSKAYDFNLLVMEDISLYAGWKTNGYYNITFDSAGGSTVPDQAISENELVTKPADPEKTGYTFHGWLTENHAYFEFDEAVNRNLTLTADWLKESEVEQTLDDILDAGNQGTTEQIFDENKGITNVEVAYKLNDTGKVVATQIKTGAMLNIPGYLTAIDINALGGTVTDATISFHYDPIKLVADGIDPQNLAIVWYDEGNDIVVLLDSQIDIDNSTVNVSTNHFSKYAVVDLTKWMASQTVQLPTIRTDEVPYYSVVLAMDCSGSMSGTKMSKSIEAAQNLIDVLTDKDCISLLSFESSTQTILDQVQLVSIDEDGENVDNKAMIKEQIAGLHASGGTNIESVLQQSMQSKSEDVQYQSFVILLSDGQSSVSNSVLDSLKANGQRVIAVGIGSDVDQSLMQRIADATDGTYLYCENAEDLATAFQVLQDAYIGSTEDSDGDGLPDLVETTGMRDQYGEIWTTDPKNPDSDGDGISDGKEMGSYHPLVQHPYFQRTSRPDMYTVKSEEAYLLMPEGMMYAVDTDDNKVKLEMYVSDGRYRMVPDLLTPTDSDGIPKEYIYSPPKNLKVELSGLPDGVVIDSLQTVNEGLIPDTLTTSYKTTAILSYTKNVVLENVTWIVTADNCSEWSGYAEDGIKATYVKKTQSVPETKVQPKVETSKAEQARLDLSQAALDLVKKLYSKAESETTSSVESARANVKSMMDLSAQCHRNDIIPDELYDAFALGILDAMDGSALEKYETDMKKLTNQIYKQIKGGLISSDPFVETVNGIPYTISYNISALYGAGAGCQTISWRDSRGSHGAILTWENVSSRDGCKALAEYCAALAQLNKGVWTDFMSYYVSDAFGLMDITSVTKKDVDKVFSITEKTIKALCNKDDADALIKEMGDKIEEKLKSRLTNKFKSFIKDNVPHGDKIVKAAERYNTAKKKYDEFQKFVNSSDSEKAAKAFSKFEDAYKKLKAEIDAI